MAVKAQLIQSLLREHFHTLKIPESAWKWDGRNARLLMVVNGQPKEIPIKAGETTLRELSFSLGRIQGWWECGAIST